MSVGSVLRERWSLAFDRSSTRGSVSVVFNACSAANSVLSRGPNPGRWCFRTKMLIKAAILGSLVRSFVVHHKVQRIA